MNRQQPLARYSFDVPLTLHPHYTSFYFFFSQPAPKEEHEATPLSLMLLQQSMRTKRVHFSFGLREEVYKTTPHSLVILVLTLTLHSCLFVRQAALKGRVEATPPSLMFLIPYTHTALFFIFLFDRPS